VVVTEAGDFPGLRRVPLLPVLPVSSGVPALDLFSRGEPGGVSSREPFATFNVA
jgi:hypothetical protein